MAAWSTITWSQNSKKSNGSEVEIQKLNAKHIAGLMIGCMIVTFLFYELLKYLNTPNLMFSTVSIVTSFLAATLTMLRSSYYALGYASNEMCIRDREYRDSVPDSAVGLIQKSYEIFIDIPDEPGTIATTTTLLALNNVSIKNIGIIHNREFEEGVLKIMLYDDESAKKATKILRDKNYTVYERK